MKFLLVDQFRLYPERDAWLPPPGPGLGAACLAGACRHAGVPIDVYDLTSRFLEHALLRNADHIADLLEQESDTLRAADFLAQHYRNKGRPAVIELLNNNHRYCVSPGPEEYTCPKRVHELGQTLKSLVSLLWECIGEHDLLIRALAREILDRGADVIGFSVHTMANPALNALVKLCAAGGARIIAGGALTFHMDSEACRDFFFTDMGVDVVLKGYADETLPRLLENPLTADRLSRIPGAIFRDGAAMRSGPDPAAFAPEKIPEPDYSHFDLDRYFFPARLLPVQISRGCYWKKCAFCRREVNLRGFRAYSPETAADTVISLSQRWGVRCFTINDECLHPDHAHAFSNTVIANQTRPLHFMAGCRPDPGFTPGVLNAMAEAGFRAVFWGIESGDDGILGRMAKGTTSQGNARLLRAAHDAGIANLCFFLTGFPGDTEETAARTLAFIRDNRGAIDAFRMNPFILFPDTAVFRNPGSFGLSGVQPVEGEDGYTFHQSNGLNSSQSRAIVQAVIEQYRNQPGRFVSGRFTDVPTAGHGDEKFPFFFWQACRAHSSWPE